MNRGLVLLFVAVQAIDLATYWQAPQHEANPVMAALPPGAVAAAKVAGVLAVVWMARRIRTASLRDLGLALAIAVGAFGIGTNVAILSVASAMGAQASRPAPVPAESSRQLEVPATERTAAPGAAPRATLRPTPSPTIATRGASPEVPPAAKPPVATTHRPMPRLHGVATWYRAPAGTAAAGPELRRAIGERWRGTTVSVNGVRLVLRDFCACPPRHGQPTLVDLSDEAFRRIAPLSRGVVNVTVEVVRG